LVNVLSIVSFFSATKAALWSLTNGIRVELRQQGTLVVAVHSSFIDTRLSAGLNVPKHSPQDVTAQVLDAVEAGREEVLVDERTRGVKAALNRDLDLIYPDVERQWQATRR
jgi:short-subunit dehydrogenase